MLLFVLYVVLTFEAGAWQLDILWCDHSTETLVGWISAVPSSRILEGTAEIQAILSHGIICFHYFFSNNKNKNKFRIFHEFLCKLLFKEKELTARDVR